MRQALIAKWSRDGREPTEVRQWGMQAGHRASTSSDRKACPALPVRRDLREARTDAGHSGARLCGCGAAAWERLRVHAGDQVGRDGACERLQAARRWPRSRRAHATGAQRAAPGERRPRDEADVVQKRLASRGCNKAGTDNARSKARISEPLRLHGAQRAAPVPESVRRAVATPRPAHSEPRDGLTLPALRPEYRQRLATTAGGGFGSAKGTAAAPREQGGDARRRSRSLRGRPAGPRQLRRDVMRATDRMLRWRSTSVTASGPAPPPCNGLRSERRPKAGVSRRKGVLAC